MAVVPKKSKQRSSRVVGATPLFTGEARPKYVVPNYNVYEAALDRIRWLFDEFDNKVSVSNSGGKDSTVVVELAAIVAKEKDALPLRVMWLDQECEFQATVDYQRYLMYERDDIDFHWYQVPFYMENATDLANRYTHIWGPDEEWVREKEPDSIKENVYGQDEFYDLLAAITSMDWDGCVIDGLRGEESPARRLTTTSAAMYKWCTWVGVDAGPQFVNDPSMHRFRFHPVYDWKVTDVWKAIYDHDWRYNEHYDQMFHRGVPTKSMRVSNYHHEQALTSLNWLQEIEPETWEAATRRLEGISTYGHLQGDQYPKELPYMFASWEEYMYYLIDNLIPNEDERPIFHKQYTRLQNACTDVTDDTLAEVVVKAVIGGDYYGVQHRNFIVSNRAKAGMKGRSKKA